MKIIKIFETKGEGSCVDLILTNLKYSFKFSTTFETGLSDHHYQ